MTSTPQPSATEQPDDFWEAMCSPTPESLAWRARQEAGRRQSALASLSSPLYRARMERLGMEEYLRTYSDGAIY